MVVTRPSWLAKCFVLLALWVTASATTLRSKAIVGASLQDETSSYALHADMRSDAAILSQLTQTENVMIFERTAIEEQTESLAAQVDAFEKHVVQQSSQSAHGGQQDFLCSSKTGGTCNIGDCADWRENVECVSGQCVCKAMFCADGHGRCRIQKEGRLLPDTYKISFKSAPNKYLCVVESSIAGLIFDKAEVEMSRDPGKKGQWRVAVNNDDTLMLYVEDSGGTNTFLHVESYECGDDMCYRPATASFDYPQRFAFQPYKDNAESIFLKDARHNMYLYGHATWFTETPEASPWSGVTSEMIFDPPLDEVNILKMSSSRVQASLLTLLCIFAHILVK